MVSLDEKLEAKFTYLPRLWDVNYNSNNFEIVNQFGSPILQVIYKQANEIEVNGIFTVDTNSIIAFYDGGGSTLEVGGGPTMITIHSNTISLNNSIPTNINSLPAVNGILNTTDTNKLFYLRFPGQIAIFKYPSWKYPGELDSPNPNPFHFKGLYWDQTIGGFQTH